MRVVITGGAGFVGSHLCERLLADGCQVVCADNLSTGRRENMAAFGQAAGFRFQLQDVCEPLPITGAVDAVMHLASPASPVDYARMAIPTLMTGSAGTLRALELARAKGAIFVLASTSEVYGDPQVHPQPEEYWGHVNPIGPRSMYDEAKRFAEALTMAFHRDHGVNTHIVRIFNTYGPRMRPRDGRVISTFIRQALTGEPLTVAGDGQQTRSFCYVSDLVEGLTRMLALAPAEDGPEAHLPVNLGNTEEYTVRRVAEMVLRLTGSQSRMVLTPLPADDPKLRRPVLERASRLLAWCPAVNLETGLQHTIAWFRQMGQSALSGEYAAPAA